MSTQLDYNNFSIEIDPFEEFDDYEEEYPSHSNGYNLSSKQLNNCQITNPHSSFATIFQRNHPYPTTTQPKGM